MSTRPDDRGAPPEPDQPPCGHRGCDAPGTVVTVLCGDDKVWELHHCEAHQDGLQIARALGFEVIDLPRAS